MSKFISLHRNKFLFIMGILSQSHSDLYTNQVQMMTMDYQTIQKKSLYLLILNHLALIIKRTELLEKNLAVMIIIETLETAMIITKDLETAMIIAKNSDEIEKKTDS